MAVLAVWRQVFVEAGGQVPQWNVERMLRTTWIPVPAWDNRRLDLVAPGLNVEHGLPYCVTLPLFPAQARQDQALEMNENQSLPLGRMPLSSLPQKLCGLSLAFIIDWRVVLRFAKCPLPIPIIHLNQTKS